MTKVKPLGDRALVKVIKRERVTPGGIVLPDQVREESDRGEVIEIGPGSYDDQAGQHRGMPVSLGDTVLFSPYAGTKVSVDEVDYLLLRENDILGVLE